MAGNGFDNKTVSTQSGENPMVKVWGPVLFSAQKTQEAKHKWKPEERDPDTVFLVAF